MSIILYDIAMDGATPSEKAWSPSTFKTRFALNFKGLAHKTQWLSFVEVAPKMKELGLAPHVTDDPRKYTVPTIHDPATKRTIMGSQDIAAYLDEQYPEHPALFPPRTRALQAAFYDNVPEQLIVPIFTSLVYEHLNKTQKVDRDYFYKSREEIVGCAFDDILPKGEAAKATLASIKTILDKAAGWIDAGAGKFVGGDEPVNADITLFAMLFWAKQMGGEDHAVYKTIAEAGDGRWVAYMAAFEKWSTLY